MRTILALGAAVTLLCACGEREQALGVSKQDAAAFTGTNKPYVAPGWKPGDKTSWESHLKARGQNSQNEYTKTN